MQHIPDHSVWYKCRTVPHEVEPGRKDSQIGKIRHGATEDDPGRKCSSKGCVEKDRNLFASGVKVKVGLRLILEAFEAA